MKPSQTELPLHRAPYSEPTTSYEAAKEIVPHLSRLRAAVLDAIRRNGEAGLTDEEICQECDLAGNTVRPRRLELLKAGLIVDSGRTTRTHSGRRAKIWVAT